MAVQLTRKAVKACAYTQLIDGSPAVFVDGFIYEGFGLYLARYVYDAWKVHGKAVKIFISSDGGLLTEGTTYYDFIRAKGIATEVEIYGKAGSTATLFGAASGAEHTSIGESSEYFIHRARFMRYDDDCCDWVHMDPTPETQAELDRTNALLVDIYVKLTGKTADEINALLDRGDEGVSMSADEAVSLGFCGQIIPPIASNIAAFKPIAEAPKTMAEKAKGKVPVKLNFGKAVTAAFGGEVTAEVDLDQAVADQLAAKDEEITALKAQIQTLETSKPAEGEAPKEEAAPTADAKVVELEATISAKDREVLALNTAHAEKVKALEAKIPLAKPTVADNKASAVAAMPGDTPNPDKDFVNSVFAQMSPAERAQYDVKLRAKNAQKAQAKA